MTRKLYRHTITGVVTPLSDTFAKVFGDRFELVQAETEQVEPKRAQRKAKSTEDSATGAASKTPDADASLNSDSSKEGNK